MKLSSRPFASQAVRNLCALLALSASTDAALLPDPLHAIDIASETPIVSYHLAFEPGTGESMLLSRPPVWRLTIEAVGLDPNAGAATLVWRHWDDWKQVDSLFVEVGETSPAVENALLPGNAMVLHQPDQWDGSFKVEVLYRPAQAGTHAQAAWGELPLWSPSFSIGQTRSLFPQVYQDYGRVHAQSSVSLTAPDGWAIASGWGGSNSSMSRFEVDPTHGNGLLAFGKPLDAFSGEADGARIDVLQYGRAHKVAKPVGAYVEKLAAAMLDDLGRPFIGPIVVFINDRGSGGMATDYGLILSYSSDTPDWQVSSPYYQHFVAHELFHLWLGIAIEANESITWFHEGFTEYLSLWYLASTGVIEKDWFAERLIELGAEAEQKSAWGDRAFADQSSSWRDGDGPIETMAYKAGSVLAFEMDLALRQQGHPGLLALLQHLLKAEEPGIQLNELEAWCAAHGLHELWAKYVDGTDIPDFRSDIATAMEMPDFFEFED